MQGRVVSSKLKNTATVLVERESIHPLYKKAFARSKRYLVDDRIGVKMGDIVEIVQIRPISKNKYFGVVKVIGKSIAEIAEEQMKAKAAEIIEEVMPEEKEELSKKMNSEKEVVMDDSAVKTKSRKKVRTESSK